MTASRLNLLGVAKTASQGTVTKQEIALRPIFRIGQLYETVPGLVVTVHSGESKANQYQLRGFDLDHGTDFASFVDGMPVNRGTNAHSQGYSDQNFLIPQIVQSLDYTKGPYYANTGDFGAVGSARVHLTDDLPNQVSASVGTLRDYDLFAGGTYHIDSDDRIWAAVDVSHFDGPWDPPSNFNKVDAAVRFSHGTDANGFSLTGLFYQSAGRLETDQSVFAVQQGLIGRYGVLDPTDHAVSSRVSLSGHYGKTGDHWTFAANAYVINSTMTLVNNFTHFLLDPVNGDQEQQDETRNVVGGDAALTLNESFFGIRTDTVFGVQERHDKVFVDRRHTLHGDITLDYCEVPAVPGGIGSLPPPPADTPAGALNDGGQGQAYAAVHGNCNADQVGLNDLGAYVENTTYWTRWLRTVIGFREEYFYAHDHSLTTGFDGAKSQTLPQPKGSLILGPWLQSEIYVSAGQGFHSNDVRGVFGTVGLEGLVPTAGPTPLLAPTTGEEIGLRSNLIPKTAIQIAVFQEDFSSELAFDEDQGQDLPTAPSRRQGVEVSAQYRPLPWIEFNTDLSFTKARYQGSLAELQNVFQLDGNFITNAPSFVGSAGVLIDNLGPWYGSLQWRDLGPYPVVDGSESPHDKGYSEFNLDIGYKVNSRLKLQLSIYNLLNTKANAAAFDYTSRLTPTSQPVTGLQVHPLEPTSARFSVTANF
ncbi:MAG TPA: TonB-dependent receptor [Caulobacteraceae bacterium]|nr:TonB-dependent receptor [Caulobacteraceae bacterium]